MRTYTRKPEWNVIIRRPDYTASTFSYTGVSDWSTSNIPTTQVSFVSSADKSNGTYSYTDLISYDYSNTMASQLDPFNLNLVTRQDINGLTWKDKIKARDIVFIYEFKVLRYIGVVKTTTYSSTLLTGEPQRSITISGQSIGGMLESFKLTMNAYLWNNLGTTSDTASAKLIDALSSKFSADQSVSGTLKSIIESFTDIALVTTNGFKLLLDEFLELESNLQIRYPMSIKVYQENENTIWSIFRLLFPLPVHEIFGKYEDGKYKLICRETPFDYDDWKELTLNKIDSLFLVDHSLSDTDDEVYTHYYSTMPNSVYSEEENYANNALNEVSVFDEDKKAIYGFRQLQATFPFFDLDQTETYTPQSAKDFLKENSVRMYAWYKNNDEFLSGDITLMTVPNSEKKYPEIGERLQYMRGSSNSIEFYIEGVTRRTVYAGTMTSTYKVTRGYEYSTESATTITKDAISVQTPQVRRIKQLGKKLKQTELTEAQLRNL